MHLSILFCLVVAASAFPERRTYGLPAAPSHRQESASLGGSGFGQAAGSFEQAAGGFGQAAGGFGQAAGGFGQGASHSAGLGLGAADVRGGSFAVHSDDDDDDDDDHQFAGAGFASGPSFAASGPRVAACGPGQVHHADGSCVAPEIVRNIFLYNAPQIPVVRTAPAAIPTPKLIHNVVFVHTPEGQAHLEPVVVPPPQHKTLVYVLTKGQAAGAQRVIEVPSTPDTPEVFYINVDDGSNPQLPIGIDLRSALAAAASQQGQLIEGGAAATRAGHDAGLGAAGGFVDIRGDDDHDDSDESLGGAGFGGISGPSHGAGIAGPSQGAGYSLPQPSSSYRGPQ